MRRFPPPWTAEQIPGGFVVKDATGQSLALCLRPRNEGSSRAPRKTPSTLPPSETAAERDKRWVKHLQAVDARGDRYQGDGESPGLSAIGRDYKRYGNV